MVTTYNRRQVEGASGFAWSPWEKRQRKQRKKSRADFAAAHRAAAQKRGLQPHRFRYWLTEVPDAQRDEKIRKGCEVYAKAPERAIQGERTISMDELTGVQVLERKHPDLPMQPGHVLRREFEYIRHGTLSWFLNFDVVTAHVIEPSWGPTRTEEDALSHLQRLIARFDDQPDRLESRGRKVAGESSPPGIPLES